MISQYIPVIIPTGKDHVYLAKGKLSQSSPTQFLVTVEALDILHLLNFLENGQRFDCYLANFVQYVENKTNFVPREVYITRSFDDFDYFIKVFYKQSHIGACVLNAKYPMFYLWLDASKCGDLEQEINHLSVVFEKQKPASFVDSNIVTPSVKW